jgi:predicted ATPase with chaperone activity
MFAGHLAELDRRHFNVPVEVELNAGYGDILIVIVGLPDTVVKKPRDRVMTALINSGFKFTFGRTTINSPLRYSVLLVGTSRARSIA